MLTPILEELTRRSCLRTLGHNPTEQEMWRFMAQVGDMQVAKTTYREEDNPKNLWQLGMLVGVPLPLVFWGVQALRWLLF
jgi:hypothetical protein